MTYTTAWYTYCKVAFQDEQINVRLSVGEKAREPRQGTATLRYPHHAFSPEDWLGFVESKPFEETWEKLRLNDDDLANLQIAIMTNPKGAPVMKGTGGMRKLRFAPPDWPSGKSNALRVCYVYFEDIQIVFLGLVFTKSRKQNITAREGAAMTQQIARVHRQLSMHCHRIYPKKHSE